MNDTETCCNGSCNQGRDCVRRTGNTSGSVWIDLLTFIDVRLPLWWQQVWPGFFLLGVLIVSSVFVVWALVSGYIHFDYLLSLIDFTHVHIRPQ